MKLRAVLASLLLSFAVYSADTLSATDDDSDYFIESVVGNMPIRSVVVKRNGQQFTSYLAFQFDCASQKYSQTGFFSSPEIALAELSKIDLRSSFSTSLSNLAHLKARKRDSELNVSNGTQTPSAS